MNYVSYSITIVCLYVCVLYVCVCYMCVCYMCVCYMCVCYMCVCAICVCVLYVCAICVCAICVCYMCVCYMCVCAICVCDLDDVYDRCLYTRKSCHVHLYLYRVKSLQVLLGDGYLFSVSSDETLKVWKLNSEDVVSVQTIKMVVIGQYPGVCGSCPSNLLLV